MTMAHRMSCCCDPTSAQPRLVRGGWYHFAVMDTTGSVSVIIGEPQEISAPNYDPSPCHPGSEADRNACIVQAVPILVPGGHPLSPPTGANGIKTSNNPNGKAVKDLECGAYHILARCTDNTIQAWGLNSIGQCNVPTSATSGTGSKGNLTDPTNPWLTRIVGLHAGYGVSAVSFNDGSVCAWGDPAVAPIINGWTDIMMSPVQHTWLGSNDFQIVDNVDPDKPQYAKPQYTAAYNANATDVWNIKQDPLFDWHSPSEEKHCSPFFDLGVETDPHQPIDHFVGISGSTQTSYGTVQPGWPFIELAGGASCEVTTVTDPNSAGWKRWLDQRLRNNVSLNHAQGDVGHWTSCCELTIKADFAVAMRRTGQVITTRATNRKSTGNTDNPACPTGHTDGRSNCRDCSADFQVTASCMGNSNAMQGCGAVGSGNCNLTSCACCDPSTFAVMNCADCGNTATKLSQRFSGPSGCGGSWGSTSMYNEGIGCISANPKMEEKFFNHEWATPWFDSFSRGYDQYGNVVNTCTGGLKKRWIAGEQVRTSPTYVPPVNQKLQERFGWSTLAAQDEWKYINPGQTRQQSVYCIGIHDDPVIISPATNSSKCAELNKDNASAYQPQILNPDFVSNFWYPAQMRFQALTCGTNTSVWQTQAQAHGDLGYSAGGGCSGCTNLPLGNIRCAHNFFQYPSPNFGDLAYSVIYAGDDLTGPTTTGSRDKWGMTNDYRVLNGPPCGSSLSMYRIRNWGWGSKPWGPAHLYMWGSIGNQENDKDRSWGTIPYPPCHCCNDDPTDPTSDPMKLPPPYLLISNADATLNAALGMRLGFPWEANMHCDPDAVSPAGSGFCQTDCEFLYLDYLASNPITPCGTGDIYWSSYSAGPFCLYHRASSWASTRMAYAMIRADHRDCVRDATTHQCVQSNGQTVRAEAQGKCAERANPLPWFGSSGAYDNSQFIGCRKPDCTDPVGKPAIRTDRMLHIWGNLWDPCSPFPRLCECEPDDGETPAGPPPDYPFDPDNDFPHTKASDLGDYTTPCEGGHNERGGTAPKAPEADPANAVPYYPSWTRRPAGASRIAAKGSWSNATAGATWTLASPTAYEAQGPVTRYCPNCDELGYD